MRFNLHTSAFVSAAAVTSAAILIVANMPATQPSGLTVHEWGTFTSVAGEDGNAVEWQVLAGKDDLPGFVNNRGYRCLSLKANLTGTVRMETPVIYFYSPQAADAHVKVDFPKGLVTEWYPRAEYHESHWDKTEVSPNGGIEWEDVKIEPETTPSLPVENNPSRYYAARATDAAPVAAGGQHEKFLFYRGIGKFGVPISARVSDDGQVGLTNLSSEPMPTVILFENRGGKMGFRNAGALASSATLLPPSLDGSLAQLKSDLENALVAQGLFRKEAQAMVATWQDSWFEEGSRLIYIVPSRAVDTILPLHIDPAPSQTARAFVGRIELITAATKNAVEQAMESGDRSIVDRYGRFLDPILARIASDDPAKAARSWEWRASIQSSLMRTACEALQRRTTD